MCSDLLMQFKPTDYACCAKQTLLCCHKIGYDLSENIASFKASLKKYYDVAEMEAKFLFKENLWDKVSTQVMHT